MFCQPTILECFFFTSTTLTTVGYGDLAPNQDSQLMRGFTIIYIIVGVCIIGEILVGNIGILIDDIVGESVEEVAEREMLKMVKFPP